jgi:5-methylcytosine-specific restriction endonuclease McrA
MSTVLAVDISGVPRRWISFEDAIMYHAKDGVAWSLGEIVARFRGGYQKNGVQSYLETPSIIAIKGHGFDPSRHTRVVLTNRTLFARDRHVCAYCGTRHQNSKHLSREHIQPVSRGGDNTWMNVVTACHPCNHRKGAKTLKESNMELIYLPYEPSHFENMILQNRNILSDQMEYLLAGVPKHSRLLKN